MTDFHSVHTDSNSVLATLIILSMNSEQFNSLSKEEQEEWWQDYIADQELMRQSVL